MGELIGINDTWLRSRVKALDPSAVDNAITAGLYAVGAPISPINDFGLFLIMDADLRYKTQVLFGRSGLHYRTITNGSNFIGISWISV